MAIWELTDGTKNSSTVGCVCVCMICIYIYVGMCAQASREHQMSSYITFHFIPLRKGH